MMLSRTAQSAVMIIARWAELEEIGQVVSHRVRRKTGGDEAGGKKKQKKRTCEKGEKAVRCKGRVG